MKLHFYDDSIENAACGANSDNLTDNGHDVTCPKCQKIVAKLHREILSDDAKEKARKKTLYSWAV